MIELKLCKSILTIASKYNPPKGGIAQVVYCYDKYVFEQFNYLPATCGCENIWIKRVSIVLNIIKLFFILLYNRNVKIVHIHTASYNRFLFSSIYMRVAKFFGRKVVMHIHGGGFADYYRKNPEWIKSMLCKCDKVIALSSYWKKFFEEEVGCSNVVKLDNVVEEPTYIENMKPDDKIHLLFLGKICKAKGIFDLVEVINEHKDEFKEKLILHIGGGGEYEVLNKFIESSSLEDIVKYEGWINGDKKKILMNMASVYILPSYTEGLPISILEALSYGHFVLSTNVGGIPEIIDAKNGILFTPGDKAAIYTSLKHLLCDNNWKKNVETRKNSIKDNLPKNITRSLTKIYNELL